LLLNIAPVVSDITSAKVVPFTVIASASRVPSISASPEISKEAAVTSLKITLPTLPLNTSLEFVASGINVKALALSSKPKNPTLAADPVWYLNSIPLSLLSSLPGAVSPPRVIIGSSTVVTVLFTVVVVPLTVKSPPTVNAPETSTLVDAFKSIIGAVTSKVVPAFISR